MAFFLTRRNVEAKKLGIYIHIPFCKSKCQYCDFYSVGGGMTAGTTDKYLQALADHFKETGELAPGYVVDTVYFGGGTPSYFGADNLIRIMDELHRRFRLSIDAEITLEANPESLNTATLKKLLRAGFNRLSIGVQSDDDAMLTKLGRVHNFHQAKVAMQQARKAGFGNISVDLMYGLPGQTTAQWRDTLTNIVSMRPDHISGYALKIEEGTPFSKQTDLNLPDDDTQADMYLAMCDVLRDYGYEHYEISNFAKKGKASKHNMKYWTGGEYLGFGPSAASDFAGKRFTIQRDLRTYIEGMAKKRAILSECDTIPLRERAGEYIMLRLRTAEGISADEYERSFLMPFGEIGQMLQRFAERGYARCRNERWSLTEKGWLVSNRIIVAINELQEKSTPLAKKI